MKKDGTRPDGVQPAAEQLSETKPAWGPVIVPGLVQDTNALSTSTEEYSPIFGSVTSYLFEGVSFVQAVFLCMA